MMLVDVAIPSRTSLFFSSLMESVTFQIFDLNDFYDLFVKFDFEDEPLSDQFYTFGYESLYVLKNLGTVTLLCVVAVLIWLVTFTTISLFCNRRYQDYKKEIT
jgi:hypothetical protein